MCYMLDCFAFLQSREPPPPFEVQFVICLSKLSSVDKNSSKKDWEFKSTAAEHTTALGDAGTKETPTFSLRK